MKVCAICSIHFSRINCLWLGNTTETIDQLNVCVIDGIQFNRINYLRWAKTTETVSHIKVCLIDGIHFTQTNYLRLATTNRNGQTDQGLCARRADILIKRSVRDGNNERAHLMEQVVCWHRRLRCILWCKRHVRIRECVAMLRHPGIVSHFETRTVNKFWACFLSLSKLPCYI